MADDVKITVSNKTPNDYTFVFFQQDTKINGMFTKIFPTAWEIIPLGGVPDPDAGFSTNTFIYPVQMQVGVTEHCTPYEANTRYRYQNADYNSKWEFKLDNQYQRLDKLDGTNVDGTISCINRAPKLVDVAICKNGKPVIVYRGPNEQGVPQGDQGNLLLTPKIYVMYAYQMQVGTMFQSYMGSENVHEIDLTNTHEVEISLVVKNEVTGLKEWLVTRK